MRRGAQLAADRERGYLEVDASAESRPILERLGFRAFTRQHGHQRPQHAGEALHACYTLVIACAGSHSADSLLQKIRHAVP